MATQRVGKSPLFDCTDSSGLDRPGQNPTRPEKESRPLELADFSPEAIAKFWSQIKVGGVDDCWPWTGTTDNVDYGAFYLKGNGQYKSHRVAYALSRGYIPRHRLVLHTCDNPSCCNPCHVYAGTFSDNMLDKISRKRSWCTKGEGNPQSKLTNKDVLEIRRLYDEGNVSMKKLGKQFSVTTANINNVVQGKSWKHLLPENQTNGDNAQ